MDIDQYHNKNNNDIIMKWICSGCGDSVCDSCGGFEDEDCEDCTEMVSCFQCQSLQCIHCVENEWMICYQCKRFVCSQCSNEDISRYRHSFPLTCDSCMTLQ